MWYSEHHTTSETMFSYHDYPNKLVVVVHLYLALAMIEVRDWSVHL